MNIVCTDTIYSAIRYDITEKAEIYIDSSFDTYTDSFPKGTEVNAGVGWGIVDKHGRFAGYGVTNMLMPPTPSMNIAELRGILWFFAILEKNFESEYTRNTKFIVYNDNKPLMRFLSKAARAIKLAEEGPAIFDPETTEFMQTIGRNKGKIYRLCRRFDVEFRWIKGHTDNEFNNLAHNLAYSCYKTTKSGKDYVGERRLNSIRKHINKLHSSTQGSLRNIDPMTNTLGQAFSGQEDKLAKLLGNA